MKFNYDFLGIGDITVDNFIRVEQADVHADKKGEHLKICLSFADKVPYEESIYVPAVGNASNAAVAAARLGLKSALMTNLGDDLNGLECIKALQQEEVETQLIAIRKSKKTNLHYVLWYKDDRTILVKHENYDYKLYDFDSPRWVYLSSLGRQSLPFHQELEKYFEEHDEIKLAFQPGTFQMELGWKVLEGIYKRSDLFFCNKEESQRILGTKEEDIRKLLKEVSNLGPKTAVITDGVNGAYSYDGKEILFMRPYPDPKPPLQRTGAGDAFSSTFTVAIALGKSVREAMMWAPINPMSVVQKIGSQAGLLTRKELEEYLAKAPADYKPEVIG
ncbi:carbohydrate kinase family protein [Candidatus Azambacteria bacterium]|nr:carbohydrate kinase family protein [Candidatus Azambacteria bacterium]